MEQGKKTMTMKSSSTSRRNWRSEEAIAKTVEYLSENPDASGSDVARHLKISETQGKYYRRLALEKLQSERSDTSLNQ